jgi:superfamily II DNA or RNA helicase
MHGVTKPMHRSQSPTFDKFKISYLDPDTIKGLFWADDALLQYEYYNADRKETGTAHFTPLLEGPHGGDYKPEHQKLEHWFIDEFFGIFQERIRALDGGSVNPASLKGVREHFFAFRQSLNKIHRKFSKDPYVGSLPDIDPIKILLKKLLVNHKKDPLDIDNVGQVFDPGSALFFLELYVTLKDSNLLSSLQEDLIKLSPHEIDKFTTAPRIIVLPWPHQQAAFDAWVQSGRMGIIEMATATGKTLVGLMAIEDIAKKREQAKIRVLSHSRALLNQWKRESVQKLGLLQNVYMDFNVAVTWKGISIEFHTIQSVMDHPELYPADLLIFDEVHHLAGPEFRKALQIPCPEKMGLSATVEGELKLSILKEELGPVVYQFGLKDALIKGIIPSFEWKVIPVYLAVTEAEEFRTISKAITVQFSSVRYDSDTIAKITAGKRRQIEDLGDFIRLVEQARYKRMELPAEWKRIQALILKRRWIIHKSQPRLEHAMALAHELAKTKKVILFTMDTDSCDYLGNELKKDNDNVFVIHSFIKGDPYVLIERFKRTRYGALIGAQMLGEGIDIPDAEIGINVAASKTRLQLTQRMGRILRKGTGSKKTPVFYHYVAIPEQESYIPEEDDVAFLDDLAWVQDAALRMGLDAEVVGNEDLLKQRIVVENSFSARFFAKDLTKDVPKFGTFNLKYVMSQLSDQSVFRIVAILQNLDPDREISDSQWARIIRLSCGKKKRDEKNWEHLDIPGYWWLLVLGKRNPSRIIEIFNTNRPNLAHAADEKDEEIITSAREDLNKPEETDKISLETLVAIADQPWVSYDEEPGPSEPPVLLNEPVLPSSSANAASLPGIPEFSEDQNEKKSDTEKLSDETSKIPVIQDPITEYPGTEQTPAILNDLTVQDLTMPKNEDLEDLFEPGSPIKKQDINKKPVRDVDILKAYMKTMFRPGERRR